MVPPSAPAPASLPEVHVPVTEHGTAASAPGGTPASKPPPAQAPACTKAPRAEVHSDSLAPVTVSWQLDASAPPREAQQA